MAPWNLLALVSFLAAASARVMVLHESRPAAPAGFVRKGMARSGDMITLRVALASNDAAGLEAKLLSLSTPGSVEFRNWLSKEEVRNHCLYDPPPTSKFQR
jgi:tripeptidyl-peptidase-1